jgi:predicted HAD superfamily Cof-like phosphohydrolase
MPKLVEEIYEFNSKAGFLGKGMDSFLETAYILEEAVEGYEDVFNNPDDPEAPVITARVWALGFLNQVKAAKEQRKLPMPSEVAELDKAIDGVVFNIGKMAKMGLSVEQIYEAFGVVSNANMAKLTAPKDELGKQLKPEGWTGPEPQLQAILDKRKPVQPTLFNEES